MPSDIEIFEVTVTGYDEHTGYLKAEKENGEGFEFFAQELLNIPAKRPPNPRQRMHVQLNKKNKKIEGVW